MWQTTSSVVRRQTTKRRQKTYHDNDNSRTLQWNCNVRLKCFIKILRQPYVSSPPTARSPGLKPRWLCCMGWWFCSAAESVSLSDFQKMDAGTISKTEWWLTRTSWENLDQQIIDKSMDHYTTTNWRLRCEWMVDTLSSCFDWFICCRDLLCSVCVLKCHSV